MTDDDGGKDQKTFAVTVRNVDPTLAVSGNQQVNTGVALNLVDLGVFTDPGFANPLNTGGQREETFTYSINWGDGTPLSTGSATIDEPGAAGVPTRGSFDGLHAYQAAGNYQVVVQVAGRRWRQ